MVITNGDKEASYENFNKMYNELNQNELIKSVLEENFQFLEVKKR